MRRSIVATWCLHVFFRHCPELRKATFKRCELVHLWWYSATSYWCLWLGMCTLEPKENNNSINNSTSTTVVFLKGEAGCDIGDVGITVFVVGLNLRTSELPDIQRSRGRFLFQNHWNTTIVTGNSSMQLISWAPYVALKWKGLRLLQHTFGTHP